MSPTPNSLADICRPFPADPVDVLIIGGGIVGAGVARDAALRGLKVALIDQHDFAAGTSSRSSRLLHGGLRYLAQGRIGLVHEASVEKKVVHEIAPHLAAPLPFVFPTYRGQREWVLWQLKVGVKLYDVLCGGRNLGNSSWLDPEQVLRIVPGLQPRELAGGVRYFDAFTNDARLTLDTLRSAARAGARLFNYCRFEGAQRDGACWTCRTFDEVQQRELNLSARTVVNATGPWAEGIPHSGVKLRATKGVHLVVDHARVPVSEAVVMTEGARILFAIPWGRRTILGTTDTDYAGRPEDVRVEAPDVEYILGITNRCFPAAALDAGSVISGWAGLRPLIADPSGQPSDISRSHEIRSPERGWWDVAGGKLTTYRLMAEQTVDHLMKDLGRQRIPCRTASEPLLPPMETAGVSGLIPPEPSRQLVEHYIAREWARHLEDVLVRRTSWLHYFESDGQVTQRAAEWMGGLLGWSREQQAEELAQCLVPAVATQLGERSA